MAGPSPPPKRGTLLRRFRFIIASVPRGRVITYGQVARAAGHPGAARLTVRALRSGEGLPWHRVIGAGGRISLGGLEGQEQRLRLEAEGIELRGGKVPLEVYGWTPGSSRRRGGGTRRRRASGPRPASARDR